jgi:hypothetical protein
MANEGILTQVSLGKETTLGTAVVPDISVAVLASDGVVTEEEAKGVEGIDGSPALNKEFIQGIREYNGSFEMNAYPNGIGYLMASAFGSSTPTVTAGETIVFDHAFVETVAKTSITLEQKIGSITERFAGFVASKFSLQITVDEPIKFLFEGKALSKASATAITPAFETSAVFDWTDIQSITLGGVDIKCAISELTIEYTNNLQNFHGLCGSSDPTNFFVEPSEVTGSITAYLTSEILDLQAVFEAKTQQALVITIEADETIGVASKNKLVVTVPKMVLNTYAYPIDTGYVEVSSDLVARQDPTDGLIKATLTNLVTSY